MDGAILQDESGAISWVTLGFSACAGEQQPQAPGTSSFLGPILPHLCRIILRQGIFRSMELCIKRGSRYFDNTKKL